MTIITCRYASKKSLDLSWSEVGNFIKILNVNLHDCEQSPYCSNVGFKGFKKFVVQFSILMAKVHIIMFMRII